MERSKMQQKRSDKATAVQDAKDVKEQQKKIREIERGNKRKAPVGGN